MLNRFKLLSPLEIILVISLSVFSFWLMFSTFSYENGSMLIGSRAWSDFAGHIPLIRSFSFGSNFPPEYPIFPGEPIRYHFLFYLMVGMLEKIGLRIDFALNILSSLSFFLLIFSIYLLGKILFKSKAVGFLGSVFFLFNGSFSFLEFFKTHPFSPNFLNQIFSNTAFPSFGPYDGKVVSAFWNLNIYTNQRHFALPLAFFIILLLIVIKSEIYKKKMSEYLILLFGIILGILPFFHSGVFIMIGLSLISLFILLPKERKPILFMLLIAGLLSLPRIIFLGQASAVQFHFGYLAQNQPNLFLFLNYWLLNFGLFLILIPVGFILSSKFQKKIFLSVFPLFLIGNLFQFSPEIAGNHKFFNAFLIIANLYAAFAMIKLWRINLITKTIFPIMFVFLIFSGVIDFFVIKNDSFIKLSDYKQNEEIAWIMKNTAKNSVFLNSSYLYDPASLAGRKIFFGWPYFSWSMGYDTDKRGKLVEKIFQENNKSEACKLLLENSISYIETKENADFFASPLYQTAFIPVYSNPITSSNIFDVKKSCK